MSKKSLIIIILIAVISVAGGYFYAKQTNEKPEDVLHKKG